MSTVKAPDHQKSDSGGGKTINLTEAIIQKIFLQANPLTADPTPITFLIIHP